MQGEGGGGKSSEVRRNVSTVSKYEVTESDSLEKCESLHRRTQRANSRNSSFYLSAVIHSGAKEVKVQKILFFFLKFHNLINYEFNNPIVIFSLFVALNKSSDTPITKTPNPYTM